MSKKRAFQEFLNGSDSEDEKDNTHKRAQFDKFTDPSCLAEKLATKRKRIKKEQDKGKLFATDMYNFPLEKTEYELLKTNYNEKDDKKNIEFLQNECNIITVEYINFKYKGKTNSGFSAIYKFLACCKYCKEWLEVKLKNIGWNQNMTSYNPSAVSNSCKELQESTIECYKIACKQMIQFLKFKE
jgi:hypothetical protein